MDRIKPVGVHRDSLVRAMLTNTQILRCHYYYLGMTMVRKISISISEELDAALTLATIKRHESKSQAVEILLRENPTMGRFVDIVRAEPTSGPLLGSTMARESRGRSNQRGRLALEPKPTVPRPA